MGRLVLLWGCVAVVHSAQASTDTKIYLGAGADYHDNMALVSTNEESDVDAIARARFTLDRTDEPLTVAMRYLVERHDFLDDIQDDKTLWSGSTFANWELLTNRLELSLQHEVSEQSRDRRQADTLDNSERVSVLTVAMAGYLHPSAVDTIVLRPRFTDVQLEDTSESDSRHVAGELAWQHALSAASMLQLSGTHDRARFDDELNDYEYSSAALSYDTRLARLSYSIGVGFNWIDVDVGDDSDGYMANVSLDYLADGYKWGASAIRRLTDNAYGLSGERVRGERIGGPSDGNVDVFDIVETTEIETHATWQIGGTTSELLGRLSYVEQDYQTIPRDENSWRVELGYSFAMNPQWRLGANLSYEWSKFLDTPRYEQSEYEVELFAAWRFTERLQTRFSVAREQRDSDLAGAEYTDNIASIGIEYQIY